MDTFKIRSKKTEEILDGYRWKIGTCSKAKLEKGCSKCSKRTFIISGKGWKITACKFYFKRVKKLEEILEQL